MKPHFIFSSSLERGDKIKVMIPQWWCQIGLIAVSPTRSLMRKHTGPDYLTLPLEPTTKRSMNGKCFYSGEVDRNQDSCHCERSCVKSESISIPMRRSQHARSGRFRYDIRRNRWASEELIVTLWYLSELKIGIFKALQSDWHFEWQFTVGYLIFTQKQSLVYIHKISFPRSL